MDYLILDGFFKGKKAISPVLLISALFG